MNYNIKIAPEAEIELVRVQNWYEEQQAGLGGRFLATIKDHINGLKNEVIEHKIVAGNVRRVLTPPFPFVIYYLREEKNRTIKILAILHNKREPLKFG